MKDVSSKTKTAPLLEKHDLFLPDILFSPSKSLSLFQSILTVAWVLTACTVLGMLGGTFLDHENVIMIYLLGVIYLATRCSWLMCIYACVLSVLAFDFFVVPPRFSLIPTDPQYLFTFAMMFVVAMIMSGLMRKVTAQELLIKQSELLNLTYARQRLDEEALKESNQRLKLAMLAAKIGIWQWDTQAGTVLWDDRNFELFGLARTELEGAEQPFYDLTVDRVISCVHPDDRLYLKEQIAKVIEERSDYYCEYRVVWPDRTVHDIEARGELFFDEAGHPQQMTGVSLDVTERKRALRSLEESEQRLKLVVETAEMGIWDVDLETGIVWQSLKHAQLFGYEQLQPGWCFEDFLARVVPEDRKHVLEFHDRAVTGESFSSEFRIVNATDNAIHWLSAQGEAHKDARGKTTRMLGVVADISERKEEEQRKLDAVKHREQLAHSIVQHAPVGILTLSASLNVTDSNNTFAEMIHRNSAHLLATPLSDILPPETFRSAEAALNKNQPLQIFRQKVNIADGHLEPLRYWDMAFWPIVTPEGELEGAVLQIIDCTDTVNLEQQRDDFVAAIAHDIKNPLIGAERIFNILCSQSQAIAQSEQANLLSLLKDNNHNLLNLVQNLVDVYRCESMTYPVHYQTLDLKCLVASCLEQVADFAESRHIHLVNDMSESPSPVQADEVGIRRVLMNLLHNAIKFDKEGGTTSISIKQANGALQIQVADTGDGIDEEDQKKLFKRFSQGKAGSRYSSGTGLGLHVCKQIILAHHGTISCKSTVGRGSTFSMSLPLLAPDKVEHLPATQIDTASRN